MVGLGERDEEREGWKGRGGDGGMIGGWERGNAWHPS